TSFSELQPISNLTENLAYLYNRVETSATADLRTPSTSSGSGEVQLAGKHNSTRPTQDRAKQSRRDSKPVPVPPELRLHNEDDNTLIKYNTLLKRKRSKQLIPIPPELRLHNENNLTLIKRQNLDQRKHDRKLVPIPPELWLHNENEHTRIRYHALYLRKRRKLQSEAISAEKPHAPHQAEGTSATNTLADSNSARENNPIHTRSPSDSNTPALHETTPQGTKKTYETLPPLESQTAFSLWLDDLNAQQSAIDYILNCYGPDTLGPGGPF
ncbi:MAG: hypothetical protein P8077_03745, partial [Gammaproteobacteria bacterium]